MHLNSYRQVTLERTFLELFHDIYDKVLLILSRIPQSPTHEIATTEDEVVDFVVVNGKGSVAVAAVTTLTSSVSSKTSFNGKITAEERTKVNKSSNLQQKVLNKDVQDVLSLVQAGSIMERVSSVNSKSRNK